MKNSSKAHAVLKRWFVFAVLAAITFSLNSCQPNSTSGGAKAKGDFPSGGDNQRAGSTLSSPTRDLSQDEAAGGHILRKHVGRTDDQLIERLNEERNISGASTYTDRAAAEHAVGAAIAQSQDRIQRWLSRTGGHANLVLDYDSPQPIGRTINRGEDRSHTCSHALVVLKYAGPNDYYVLTSYPECR
jgi:Bacterial CdiA-CT RNAse A domain